MDQSSHQRMFHNSFNKIAQPFVLKMNQFLM
jgi:hypothetical protein